MFIDTHCHIEKNGLDIIRRAKAFNVAPIIVSYCEKDEISNFVPFDDFNVFYTLGYHPSEVKKVNDGDRAELKIKVLSNLSVVGIGEIGLDYHYGKEDQEEQIDLFRMQLSLAQELNFPVVIHSRDATLDTINILKEYKVRGVIHCFTGSLETAQIYQSMGFLLGIGGVLTFKNSHLKDVVKALPLSSFVLETDSPYLSPEPYRGQENEPKNIPVIASAMASIKEVSLEEVERITTDNARLLFDLPNTV